MTQQSTAAANVPDPTGADAIRAKIAEHCTSVWLLSTLRASAEAGLLGPLSRGATVAQLAGIARAPAPVIAAMLDVLASAGMVRRDGDLHLAEPGLAAVAETLPVFRADLTATFGNAGRLVDDARRGTLGGGWEFDDPEIILAQATMSRALGARMNAVMAEKMPSIEARLSAPGARFLDVGAGACGGAISLCLRYPRATLVAIEPRAASRALAAGLIAEAGCGGQIEVRDQTIETLVGDSEFDFAFVAQQFMPEAALDRGLANVFRALKPGGWVTTGTMSRAGDDLRTALLRMRNVLWGGGTRDVADLTRRLEAAGFVSIITPPPPPGAIYSPIVARRPDAP